MLDGADLGLVPHRAGAGVVWRCHPAVSHRQVPDPSEADQALRPDPAADHRRARRPRRGPLASRGGRRADGAAPAADFTFPDGMAPRAVRLASLATRCRTIVDLALEDDGGSVTAAEADARRQALAPAGPRSETRAWSPPASYPLGPIASAATWTTPTPADPADHPDRQGPAGRHLDGLLDAGGVRRRGARHRADRAARPAGARRAGHRAARLEGAARRAGAGRRRPRHAGRGRPRARATTAAAARAAATSPCSACRCRPPAVAAIAGRIADTGGNIDRIERMARYPVTAIELHVSGADPDRLRVDAGRGGRARSRSTSPSSRRPCCGTACGWS